MTVSDKVILITGGSEGIGKAAALLLASKGAKVAIAARSKDVLDKLVPELADGFAVRVDMTDPESITEMVDAVKQHYGRIDVLVNNAGQALRAPMTDIRVEDFKKIMELNVYGPLRAMQAVVPIMKEQGGGSIVNISSNVSKMDIPQLGAYAATKYALNGMTLAARNELAAENIVISLMHPGLTATKFGEHAISNTDAAFNRQSSMQPDSTEAVAEKILEAVENGTAEQYMSPEIEKLYSMGQ